MSVLTIMGLSLRRVTRDRQALFFMILLPVLITLIIGVSIFKSVDTLSVGLVTRDSAGALSKELASQIRSTKGFQVEELDSVEAARKAIRRSNILAAVIIPKDYDAALRRGDRVSVEILVDPVRNAP
ncbi:MAG TPA: ABC transporter permease, partial [Actinomycetota bacterium]|nr:ABC transporter permease [Actinomycetota bacterium]